MKKLTITILHILPNRVRLKLSAPIKDTKTFYSNIQIIKKRSRLSKTKSNIISRYHLVCNIFVAT